MPRRRTWLLAALGLAGAAALAANASRRAPAVILAARGDRVQSLCEREGYPLDDFLERAQAIGMSAAETPDEPLSRLARRGELLAFSCQEVEKERVLGTLAPGATLQGASIWAKTPQAADRAWHALSNAGARMATSTVAGLRVVEFSSDFDWEGLSAGPDPDLQSRLARLGLKALAPEETRRALALPAAAPLGPLLRLAAVRPRSIALWDPEMKLGVERNIELLRGSARSLRARGFLLEPLPPAAPERPSPWWAGLLIALGAMWSARCGLKVLPQARALAKCRLPPASPVLESAAALAATAAACLGVGLGLRALLAWRGRELHAGAGVLAATALLGFLTLYAADLPKLARRLRDPLTGTGLLKLAGWAGLAWLLICASSWGDCASPWWLPWKWQEALLGWPCLMEAHRLLILKWECQDREKPGRGRVYEPRPWLLIGLLAPLGAVSLAALPGVPLSGLIAANLTAMGAGVAVGAALTVIRLRFAGAKPAAGPSWEV